MKYDIEITLRTDILKEFNVSDKLTVSIDKDYCADYDDVIQNVENTIWEKYGKSLHFGRDFDFDEENDIKICDMFNESAGW